VYSWKTCAPSAAPPKADEEEGGNIPPLAARSLPFLCLRAREREGEAW